MVALSDGARDRVLGGFFHGVEPAEWTSAVGISAPGGKLRRAEAGYRFERIQEGDVLIVAGTDKGLENLESRAHRGASSHDKS